MKMTQTQIKRPRRKLRVGAGSTLIEMMFAVSLLVLVVTALLTANLVGLKQSQLVESKAGASDTSRKVIEQLPTDIRASKMWQIGSMDGTNFIANVNNTQESGTALQLCTTTNGSEYILYYFDLSDSANSDIRLWRTASTNWNPVVIASNLINTLYFTAEDYRGTPMTNSSTGMDYKSVIHTLLQFCQFQYPKTLVGSNYLYDYYRMDIRATPHLPE